MSTPPSLRLERGLLREGAILVAGIDEVGRGALSGPVSVGVTVVGVKQRSLSGIRDSKLLTPAARARLVPMVKAWSVDWAVGHASAAEIDEVGIVAALRLSAHRALTTLSVRPDVAILDGRHDWLSAPAQGSLLEVDPIGVAVVPRVVMKVKADLTCTSVAAASVLAKVERDGIMVGLHREYPGYAWDENKGYASPDHVAALRRIGPSKEHRRSWQLPV